MRPEIEPAQLWSALFTSKSAHHSIKLLTIYILIYLFSSQLCKQCKRCYLRLFDVTEKTALRLHKTGRYCSGGRTGGRGSRGTGGCGEQLRDSIVHFGEKGGLTTPYNWQEATDAVENADLILCLGTSLKVGTKSF